MGAWSERIMAGIRERIATEAEEIGREMAADVQNRISTPVVLDEETGWMIRSVEGNYPFLETGELQASEYHDVESDGTGTTLRIINDAPHARRLHEGHSGNEPFGPAGPRPFHTLIMGEWAGRFHSRIRDAITGNR
jgi:hypothetical protein